MQLSPARIILEPVSKPLWLWAEGSGLGVTATNGPEPRTPACVAGAAGRLSPERTEVLK